MRNKLPRYPLDLGLFLAVALALIASWPFLANPGLPGATDAELHIFRIAELGFSLRAGNLYPRWAPDFYHGHGYPIFNYYAPLTYHLGNWLTLLQPQHAAAGAKLLFVLSQVLGTVGAYLLGKKFGRQGGGLLGAAAFTFSPYIFLINPHIRGDLPEVFAVALIPWALWSWESLWQDGGKTHFVIAILSAGGVLLSHNLSGLTTMILLLALSLWHWLGLRERASFWPALLAGVLVVGLTTYFWLPFLIERSYIKLDVAGEGHYDFHNHFVMLKELLAPLPRLDWGTTVPYVPMTFGLVQGLLFVLGALLALKQRFLRSLGFYVASGATCLFLITPFSTRVWEIVPGLAFYQFPWRFLGPLAALSVPPIAFLGRRARQNKRSMFFGVLLFGIVIFTALPGLALPPWEDAFGAITPRTIIEAELEGRWRGTTSTNDFVPSTVDMIPGPQKSVLTSYPPPVDRVNRYTLPEQAHVEVLPSAPWHNHFAIASPEKFLLRLYLFHFPGWRAYVDGQRAPIEIAHPEGFITVEVPAGEHEVWLRFEDTWPRALGWGIAGLSLIVGILYLIYIHPSDERDAKKNEEPSPSTSLLAWMAGIIVVMLLLKLGDSTFGWLHYHSPPGEARAAQYHQEANVSGEISLLGFDLSSKRARPGDTLDVTLYWHALHPLTETYQSFVHFVGADGEVWTQSDHLNPAGFPTDRWPTNRYVWDKHRLALPKELPSGEYTLSVGIYVLQTDTRLPILGAEWGHVSDHIVLKESIRVR